MPKGNIRDGSVTSEKETTIFFNILFEKMVPISVTAIIVTVAMVITTIATISMTPVTLATVVMKPLLP